MLNEYDNDDFFEKYSRMERSEKGLEGAGEWHILKAMLPDFKGKSVLDIGCGFGWHCKYAAENGAESVVGIDASDNMLGRARLINADPKIEYVKCFVEEYEYPVERFDVVISSLVLHYVEDLNSVFKKIYSTLKAGGNFIFNIEHPVLTANEKQEWEHDENGSITHWAVDNYFDEKKINTAFLGCDVVKYHKTLASIINGLLDSGFVIKRISEPYPSEKMLNENEYMKYELKRPMMLIVSAEK